MDITLRILTEKSGTSVLSVKRDLLTYKRKGLIFYSGAVEGFGLDNVFELFFAYKATGRDQETAFPVSETLYRHYVNPDEQISYLRRSFERYFETESRHLTDEFFRGMSIFRGMRKRFNTTVNSVTKSAN